MEAETRALLGLSLVPGVGPTLIGRMVEAFGSATAAAGASARDLCGVQGISQAKASGVRRSLDSAEGERNINAELEACHHHDVRLIGFDDEEYPRLLRHIPDPPRLLWIRGSLQPDDAVALGIVGSRKCSQYGREQAGRFAGRCASAGLTILSGGAYGIDAAAHRAALHAGGRTVAVVGSGLADPYPSDHAKVFNEITDPAAPRGALLSELPMAAPPLPVHFPRRNRIISGMSLGVLVVEAAMRSGALITARLCVEEHGRELMVVPGRVDSKTSEGCHKIIREGWGTLVTSAADVMDCLGEAGELLKVGLGEDASPADAGTRRFAAQGGGSASASPSGGGGGGGDGGGGLFTSGMSSEQRAIIDAAGEPRSMDQLAVATGLDVSRVQAELTMLEIRGAVVRRHGMFVRKAT